MENRIQKYCEVYDKDIMRIVENFYHEAMKEYSCGYSIHDLIQTIEALKKTQRENCYLLICNGRCEGLIAGMGVKSLYGEDMIFQELIWYVNEKHRRHGVKLLDYAMHDLKSRGFSSIILAVMENSKTEKLKEFYTRLGFKHFETHFIKKIGVDHGKETADLQTACTATA